MHLPIYSVILLELVSAILDLLRHMIGALGNSQVVIVSAPLPIGDAEKPRLVAVI